MVRVQVREWLQRAGWSVADDPPAAGQAWQLCCTAPRGMSLHLYASMPSAKRDAVTSGCAVTVDGADPAKIKRLDPRASANLISDLQFELMRLGVDFNMSPDLSVRIFYSLRPLRSSAADILIGEQGTS